MVYILGQPPLSLRTSSSYLLCLLLVVVVVVVVVLVPPAHGKLTVSRGNDTLTVSSMDYFAHRQPYYKRRGIGILWPWANRTATGQECALRLTVDMQRPVIVQTAQRAAKYPDTALFIYRETALQAGCQTLAQVGQAARELSTLLQSAGFPAISLLVFMLFINGTVPGWGPYARMYTSRNPSQVPDGPPAIDTMLLDQTATMSFYTSELSHEFGIHFEAEEEPGPWNDVFLSPGWIGGLWTMFALILLALLYAWARVAQLVRLKALPRDLRLAIMAITSANAIVILVLLNMDTNSYYGYITYNAAIVISALLFDLLLVYWSIRGRVAFSSWTIICFRVAILVDVIFLLSSYGISLVVFYWGKDTSHDALLLTLYQYILLPLPIFDLVIYGGFACWFIRSAYCVRRHREAQRKFIALAVFSLVAILTFVIAIVENYTTSFVSLRHENLSIAASATLELLALIKLCIRTLICLAVLGVGWPRELRKRRTRISLGAFTVDDHHNMAERTVIVRWSKRLSGWLQRGLGSAASSPPLPLSPPRPLFDDDSLHLPSQSKTPFLAGGEHDNDTTIYRSSTT
ncbi:hypothetical protein SYNPS1DRAFT_30025 [Syncephalis pseudoplumigaleata]|uniref:Uncharacterized protein n=1 Tax=Syncephalis pseudoplumigaleata TaxID=1712513 RepID=A0A4P9YW17_9FUNG|nr:hypothetical protein SYNPS1DRAFT_30025 [Syncephalis pseudoplumigaleata]|eukprot:RKP24207.1 hypothetical protein SYNPS1DRAFT_30025 [Syncephalis pseudoplumigaleata]